MSRSPWKNKPDKVDKPKNEKMIWEARLWATESYEKANQRTLDKIAAAQANRNLLRDITGLNIVEARYPEHVELPKISKEIPKTACPICNSKEFLVESFAHRKILVCERPNCIYTRAVQRRDKLVVETSTPLLHVVK